jgi:hypothetical protein
MHGDLRELEPDDILKTADRIEAALARRDAALLEVAKEMTTIAAGVDPEKCSPFQGMTRNYNIEWAARIREIVAGKKESGG